MLLWKDWDLRVFGDKGWRQFRCAVNKNMWFSVGVNVSDPESLLRSSYVKGKVREEGPENTTESENLASILAFNKWWRLFHFLQSSYPKKVFYSFTNNKLFWPENIKLLQLPWFTCWDLLLLILRGWLHRPTWGFVAPFLFSLRGLFVCLSVSDSSTWASLLLLPPHALALMFTACPVDPEQWVPFTVCVGGGSRFPPAGQPGILLAGSGTAFTERWARPVESPCGGSARGNSKQEASRGDSQATLRAHNKEEQVHKHGSSKRTHTVLSYNIGGSPHWKKTLISFSSYLLHTKRKGHLFQPHFYVIF